MNRPRILLADEHVLLTDALTNLLTKHFDIIGVARDGREMIRKTTMERPDVVVSDVKLPVLSGIEAARSMRKETPHSRLLFLTMYDEISLVQEALAAGALGYVLKSSSVSELINAICCVAKGARYVSHGISMHLLPPAAQDRPRRHPHEALTQRRRQIVQMIAQGMTMKEIAVRLGISARTAETHKYIIMRLLGVSTTACVIRYAIRTNVIESTASPG